MLLAKTPLGERIEPMPGGRAACGQCGGEVLAKCGKLVSWHWAHRVAECDSWSDGETDWHLGWKRAVVPEACEVVLGDHRADIRTFDGLVIELQHSSIDADTIAEREHHYGNLHWLFDAKAYDLTLYPSGASLSFVWQHPRRSLLSVRAPQFWDLGSGFVLRVETLTPKALLGGFAGTGVLLDAACFASQVFGNSARNAIHLAARTRASRVSQCLAQVRHCLREDPSAGLDGAVRAAFTKLSLEDPASEWTLPGR